LLLVPSLRTYAALGRQAAGRAGVAKAGTVVVRAPEPGRLKRGDRCVLQSRCGSPVRVARGGTLWGMVRRSYLGAPAASPGSPGLPGAAGL